MLFLLQMLSSGYVKATLDPEVAMFKRVNIPIKYVDKKVILCLNFENIFLMLYKTLG